MKPLRKSQSNKAGKLHPLNPHRGRYDFAALLESYPDLETFLVENPAGDRSIDFSDQAAVLALNKALLAKFYGVERWMIPPGYLCPPIPGRADAIHYLAELLAKSNDGEIPRGKKVRVLDIGTGANCIYPILGCRSYGWQFMASDIDRTAVKTARLIVESNPCLANRVKIVEQREKDAIFRGVIRKGDRYDLTMCNPPFHSSVEAAKAASERKRSNLDRGKGTRSETNRSRLNFGGQDAELWCPGGELQFIKQMIRESVDYREQVGWFSSLVSKSENLPALKAELKGCGASRIEVLEMSQGQKVSRLLAWRM